MYNKKVERDWRPEEDGGGGGGNEKNQSQGGKGGNGSKHQNQQGNPKQGGQGASSAKDFYGQNNVQGTPASQIPAKQQQGSPSSKGTMSSKYKPLQQHHISHAKERQKVSDRRIKEQEKRALFNVDFENTKHIYERKNETVKNYTTRDVEQLVKQGGISLKNKPDLQSKDKSISKANINKIYKAEQERMKQAGFTLEDKPISQEEVEDDENVDTSLARKLNPNEAPTVFDPKYGVNMRRLSNSFARVVGKIAEDNAGWATIGDDEWDIDALLKRQYLKKPLKSCKQSREKSRIILVLDTSPSCSSMAGFYGSIAQSALQLGDVEIYLAPNARVEYKYSYKDGGWFKTQYHRRYFWGFKGRHIMFFGDWDGFSSIVLNSHHNKLYWFDRDVSGGTSRILHNEPVYSDFGLYKVPSYKDFASKRPAQRGQTRRNNSFDLRYSDFKGEHYFCSTPSRFMEIAKKIK